MYVRKKAKCSTLQPYVCVKESQITCVIDPTSSESKISRKRLISPKENPSACLNRRRCKLIGSKESNGHFAKKWKSHSKTNPTGTSNRNKPGIVYIKYGVAIGKKYPKSGEILPTTSAEKTKPALVKGMEAAG